MNTNEKLNALFANKVFVEEVKSVTTIEEMKKLAAKYDVELSDEEIVEMCRTIATQMQTGEELSENALDEVAGGFPWLWVAVGVVAAGAFALGVYNGLKDD